MTTDNDVPWIDRELNGPDDLPNVPIWSPNSITLQAGTYHTSGRLGKHDGTFTLEEETELTVPFGANINIWRIV